MACLCSGDTGGNHQPDPDAGREKLALLAGRIPVLVICDLWLLCGLYRRDPVSESVSSICGNPLCNPVFGNSDVLLVAALADEPPFVGRIYNLVCCSHGLKYPFPLINQIWIKKTRAVHSAGSLCL